jgi:plastocyanin
MKRYALLSLLLPAVVLAAGCGGSKKSSTTSPASTVPPTTTSSATPKMNKHGVKDVSGMSSLNVEMDDYYFSPTIIKGKPGQKLTINLSNHGTTEHNLSITSQSINRDVEPKKTASVQVTLPQSGLVEFFCKYHKTLGMAGELQGGSGTGMSSGSSGSTTSNTSTSSGY